MKVIVAARLSKVQKDGRPGIGLDTQDTKSRGWAEAEGHEVLAVIADTKSGTVAPWDRKNLAPWVTDPELMTQYEGIVAFRNDRLSRGVWADEARIRLWAEQHGKRLMIVDGPQWPPRHDGDKWSWEAQADQARKEWEAGRERSMRSQAELRERGKLVGRFPWGYASEGGKYDRKMIAAAEGEQYAAELFTRIADGHRLPAVATWLTEVTGRTWHPRTVASVIRNPTYKGEHRARLGGTPVRYGRLIHACPALVDSDLWRRANANLDSRPSPRRGRTVDLAQGAALLSGLGYCANPDCTAGPDSPMYRIMSGSGNQQRTPYYRCSGRGATRRGCGTMVPADAADALMSQIMSGLRRPVLRPVFHPATGHQVALDDIAEQLLNLPAQGLGEDAEDAERARLRAERKRLSELPATPAWTEYMPVQDEAGERLTYGAKWTAADQAERRAWLRDAGFRLYLGKPDFDVADEDDEYEALSQVDVYEDDRALLVFRWDGDEDPGFARGLPGSDDDED